MSQKIVVAPSKLPEGAPLLTPVQIVEISEKATKLVVATMAKFLKIVIIMLTVFIIEAGVIVYQQNKIIETLFVTAKR